MSREEEDGILNNAADDEDLEDLEDLTDIADLNEAVEITEQGLKLNIDLGDKDHPAPPAVEVTPADLAELAVVEAELDTRWPETKIDPSLERIELLMDLLGSPQNSFPSIHVAGTNGKTSTVRMIESLLRAFHRRTGRTTSPHLQLVTERIGIDGVPVHPRDYVRIWREIQPYVELVDEKSGSW